MCGPNKARQLAAALKTHNSQQAFERGMVRALTQRHTLLALQVDYVCARVGGGTDRPAAVRLGGRGVAWWVWSGVVNGVRCICMYLYLGRLCASRAC